MQTIAVYTCTSTWLSRMRSIRVLVHGCHACAVDTNGHVVLATHAQCSLSESLVLFIFLAKCIAIIHHSLSRSPRLIRLLLIQTKLSQYMASDSHIADTTVDPGSITLPQHLDDFLLDSYNLPEPHTLPTPEPTMTTPEAGDSAPVFTPEQQAWIENLILTRTAPTDTNPTGSSSTAVNATSSSTTPLPSAPGNLGELFRY